MVDLVEMAKSRHLTKLFDGTVVDREKFEILVDLLRSAPNSLNVQGTHYVVASTAEARSLVSRSMEGGFEANISKVATASDVFVLCSLMRFSDEHLARVARHEREDGKFPSEEIEGSWREIVPSGVSRRESDLKDVGHWAEKQTYLAAGMLLMACAELDIDVCPMEGFSAAKLDGELGLREKGLTSTLLVAIGRRSMEDFLIGKPKSRLPREQMFTFLD